MNKYFISGIALSVLLAFFGMFFNQESLEILAKINGLILDNCKNLYLFFGFFVVITAFIIGILPLEG